MKKKSQNKKSNLIKGIRAFDFILPIDGYHGGELNFIEGCVDVPASRFLRPLSRSNPSLINDLLFKRIINEMEFSAKNNLIYHLWWHPHNFGSEIDLNIDYLSRIINYFNILKDKYGMESINMKGISSL